MMNENKPELNLSDFIFELPEELIAQHPNEQRDEARLLVRSPCGVIENRIVNELDSLLPSDSILVVNDSRVFPSRLIGHTLDHKRVEVFLLRPLRDQAGNSWLAIGKPGRLLQSGSKINFGEECSATILDHRAKEMGFNVEFSVNVSEFPSWLERNGYIPLPPYIRRNNAKPAEQSEDRETYQTIYACSRGSVAAPTAGLHFTDKLIKNFEQKRIRIVPVTLHVGAGTFLPVKKEDLTQHQMHGEAFCVPANTNEEIQRAKKNGNKVIAVGTTSLRCLESYYRLCDLKGVNLTDQWFDTNLFIYPKKDEVSYKPFFLDGLLTNFHQPGSTLFMLISALLSLKEARRVYDHAVSYRYRFLSYGDASLLWL